MTLLESLTPSDDYFDTGRSMTGYLRLSNIGGTLTESDTF